jgi:hypothetical protein
MTKCEWVCEDDLKEKVDEYAYRGRGPDRNPGAPFKEMTYA